jgi:acylphosphatase
MLMVEVDTVQAIKVQVEGKVQGVYFRASTAKKATSLGLLGWVRNLENGRVELLAQGTPEALEQLLLWCQKGPVLARVVNVYHELATLDRELCEFNVLR